MEIVQIPRQPRACLHGELLGVGIGIAILFANVASVTVQLGADLIVMTLVLILLVFSEGLLITVMMGNEGHNPTDRSPLSTFVWRILGGIVIGLIAPCLVIAGAIERLSRHLKNRLRRVQAPAMDKQQLLRPWKHAVYSVNDFAAMIAVVGATECILAGDLWVQKHLVHLEISKTPHWLLGGLVAGIVLYGYLVRTYMQRSQAGVEELKD